MSVEQVFQKSFAALSSQKPPTPPTPDSAVGSTTASPVPGAIKAPVKIDPHTLPHTCGYTMEGVKALDAILANFSNFNKHSKHIEEMLAAPDAAERASHFKYITTPHPIGNMPIEQCIAVVTILDIEGKDPNHIKLIIKEAIPYLKALKGIGKSTEFITAFEAILEDHKYIFGTTVKSDELIATIKNKLATVILQTGISTKVISMEEQEIGIRVKNKWLKEKYGLNVKTWDDADGDPEKHTIRSFPDDIKKYVHSVGSHGKGSTFLQIFDIAQNSKDRDTETEVESRISCDNKRKVIGPIEQLSNIPGVLEIKNFNNLLDPEKFEQAYKGFSQWLETAQYKGTQYDDEGKAYLNDPLDLVLRVTSAAFRKAEGLVLSDFDPSEEHIMPGLRFILEATQRFLKENGRSLREQDEPDEEKRKNCVFSQVVLPLCENRESIENSKTAFNKFLNAFDKRYKQIEAMDEGPEKEKAFAKLRHCLVPDGTNLYWAIFTGPSDLNNNIGGNACGKIDETIKGQDEVYKAFVKDHPLLELGGTKILKEVGIGVSYRRGGRFSPGKFDAATAQGINLVMFNNPLLYAASAMFQNILSQGNYERSEDFYKEGVGFHEDLYYGANGIVEQFDKMRNNGMFTPLLKIFANNQGTRGTVASEVNEYKNFRAIEAASAAAYFGTLTAPSMAPSRMDDEYDLEKVLLCPREMDLLTKELLQFSTFDYDRAKMLGFDKAILSKQTEYIEQVMGHLCKKVGIAFEPPANKDYAPCVKALTKKLLDKTTELAPDDNALIEALNHFIDDQEPLVSLKENLTSMIRSAIGESIGESIGLSPQSCANMAIALNGISNFQVPIRAYNGYEKIQQLEAANDNVAQAAAAAPAADNHAAREEERRASMLEGAAARTAHQ